MESSNKTLNNLWVDDAGQICTGNTISTHSSLASSSQPPDDILKFYRDQGFDRIAKEAGIIESSEELLTITKANTAALQPKTIKLIAVPVSSAMKSQLRVVPRPVVVSRAAPLNLSGMHPQTTYIQLPAQPAQRMARIQQQPQQQQQQIHHLQPQHQSQQQQQQQHHQQQQQHTVMPKVIQLITTPTYNGPQIQPQRNQPIWTVSKRPAAVPPPTMSHTTESGDYYTDSKRRKGALGGKGLRHFSTKVCEKVQKKGVTSYNEVADELVNEFTDPTNSDLLIDQQFDQKNIRRRVYDALNVLMAMNIISKEKKEIRWIGLPTNSAQECQTLEFEKQKLVDRIQQKTQQLNELILQQIAFKNLVQRNRAVEQSTGVGPAEGSVIQLPFILVNTNKKTVIDCNISSDKYEYLFNFDQTFEIHDDIEVLKRMGMAFGLEKGQCSRPDLDRAIKMVPKALESYVRVLANANKPLYTTAAPVTIKTEPGSRSSTSSRSADHSVDAEVALANDHYLLSRQSSFGSASDLQSTVRDSPEYTDNSESEDD